jgi:hypothetical protein
MFDGHRVGIGRPASISPQVFEGGANRVARIVRGEPVASEVVQARQKGR